MSNAIRGFRSGPAILDFDYISSTAQTRHHLHRLTKLELEGLASSAMAGRGGAGNIQHMNKRLTSVGRRGTKSQKTAVTLSL